MEINIFSDYLENFFERSSVTKYNNNIVIICNKLLISKRFYQLNLTRVKLKNPKVLIMFYIIILLLFNYYIIDIKNMILHTKHLNYLSMTKVEAMFQLLSIFLVKK